MAGARTIAAVGSARAAAAASRALGRGGGTAVSGLVGLRLQPTLIRDLSSGLAQGAIVITGTNGKTTTAHMVAEMARAAGLHPLANTSGSNLMRGIASPLTRAAGGGGRLPHDDRRIGVFEVDEATLPAAVAALDPRVIAFTNLFRDQLDRYGEVETVATLWRDALARRPDGATLVLNADDPTVASLGEGSSKVVYFGINDPALDRGCREHAADAISCACGAAYEYGVSYYGHLGHWRCPGCGRARPPAEVAAEAVGLADGRRLRFRIGPPGAGAEVEIGLGGLYNVYNALAALASAKALGLADEAALRALPAFAAAFGRQERFAVDGRQVDVFLAKNPAGLNQVLSTLALDGSRRSVLLILNDLIADGRDISWIWDADFEPAAGRFDSVLVAGRRAEEMALRLKYAEWDEGRLRVEPDLARALDLALAATAPGDCLTIVPTYTAMLAVREILAKRAGRGPFWRQ